MDQLVEMYRKKVVEEVVEGDFMIYGVGWVIGKGWWIGVELGESGYWDMSI